MNRVNGAECLKSGILDRINSNRKKNERRIIHLRSWKLELRMFLNLILFLILRIQCPNISMCKMIH